MQDVFTAVPLSASEQKCTETGTEGCSTQVVFDKMRTLLPSRLFTLAQTSMKENMDQASSRESPSASSLETDDDKSDRRNKRLKRSSHSCDASANVTEHGASHRYDSKQFADGIGKEGSGGALDVKSETKKHTQKEKTAHSRVRLNVTEMKHAQSYCGKSKQSQVVSSDANADVVEVSKDTWRSSNRHADSISTVVEKPYNLRNTKDSCELYSYNSSSQPSAKKSTSAARRRNKNRNNSFVENAASHEAELKLNDSEKKGGENKFAKSAQKGSRCKSTSNSEKIKVEDEVKKGGGCSRKDADQTSQGLLHSVRDQKLSSISSYVPVGSGRGSVLPGIGRGAASTQGKPRSSALSSTSTCVPVGRGTGNTRGKPRSSALSITSTCVPVGRGTGSTQGKPRSSAENQRGFVHGSRSFVRSTPVSAEYRLSTSNVKENWAAEPDKHHTAHADRVTTWCRDRESRSRMPAHRYITQEYSTRTVDNADQHSSFKNHSDNVCISEDWETELFMFPPSEHEETVETDVVAVREKETVKVTTYNSCSAVGDRSRASTDNKAETVSTSVTESVEDHDNNNNDNGSSSYFKVKSSLDPEQTQFELYDTVVGEKYVVNANETSDTSESWKCSVDVEHETGVHLYVTQTVNCGKPNMYKCDRNFTDDRKQKIYVSLPGDTEFSNVPSDTAEQASVSDEITEPYKIEADRDRSFYYQQSKNDSDGINSLLSLFHCLLLELLQIKCDTCNTK